MRKANLARLLARRSEGIFVAPFEQGEIGPDLFRRLEGLVSKRRDRPYRAGPSPYWVKVKNRTHPGMSGSWKHCRGPDFVQERLGFSCLNSRVPVALGVVYGPELDPLDCAERYRSDRLSDRLSGG